MTCLMGDYCARQRPTPDCHGGSRGHGASCSDPLAVLLSAERPGRQRRWQFRVTSVRSVSIEEAPARQAGGGRADRAQEMRAGLTAGTVCVRGRPFKARMNRPSAFAGLSAYQRTQACGFFPSPRPVNRPGLNSASISGADDEAS